jgi:hypothetical protein
MSAAMAVANTNEKFLRLSLGRLFDLRNEIRGIHQSVLGTGIWPAALALHDTPGPRIPPRFVLGRIDARIERQCRDMRLTFWFYADGTRTVHLAEHVSDTNGDRDVVLAIYEEEALCEVLACALECANA